MFCNAIAKISELSGKVYGENEEETKAMRVIADHVRTATFILGDPNGVVPSNVAQGYILRRLIRRAVRFARVLSLPDDAIEAVSKVYIEQYKDVYPELTENSAKVLDELSKECSRFRKTIEQGLKEFERVIGYLPPEVKRLSGKTAFKLYDTFGFPLEMTAELCREKGLEVDVKGYEKAFEEHQNKSRSGAEQVFKGGLADNQVATERLHTATHLMNAGLRKLVNADIRQRGSNITAERLRFDFNLDRPMTPEEIKAVEEYVNDAIKADVEITCEEMTVADAKASGAIGVFDSKYGEKVKVYTMGEFSKEICGGPHAKRTGELGKFRITKEQSSSAGIRRIKAVLE